MPVPPIPEEESRQSAPVSSWNADRTAETDPVLNTDQVPSGRGGFGNLRNQKQHGKHALANIRPFRLLLGTLAFVLAAGVFQTLHISFGGHSEPAYSSVSEDSAAAYSTTGLLEPEIVNGWVTETGHTVVVCRMVKEDSDLRVDGASVYLSGQNGEGWIWLPSLGYLNDEVYGYGILENYDGIPVQPEDVAAVVEDGGVSSDLFSDGYWYEEGQTNPSRAEVIARMKKDEWIREYPVTVTADGVEEQNGSVAFTVENPYDSSGYTYMNVIFRKEGKVVFADTMDVSLDEGRRTTMQVYNAPFSIPGGYDEVEVVNLVD